MMSLIQWVNMMFAGFSDIQNLTGGIPWLSSGYDSVLSLPGPRFVPWSGKIAQAVQCGQKTNKTPHGIILMLFFVVVVQSLNCVPLFATPRTAARQASLSFTISQNLLNSCPSKSVMPPNLITSSVIPFFCLQSFPASGSFPMSQFLASAGQSIGGSASASVLPVNTQGWFPLGLTGLTSLQSKGLSIVFSSTTIQEHQFYDVCYIVFKMKLL